MSPKELVLLYTVFPYIQHRKENGPTHLCLLALKMEKEGYQWRAVGTL